MNDDALILTFATGKKRYVQMAKALAISLDLQDCNVTRAIITDSNDPDLARLYPIRLSPNMEKYPHWFTKLSALELTQYNRILFLDSDCLAIKPIDKIFDAFQGSDFAVQGFWVKEIEWYGNMTATMRRLGLEQVPVFSGGFLYYERTERAQQLIAEILKLKDDYNSLQLKRNGKHVVDEVCISICMAQTGIGKVFDDGLAFSMTPWRFQGKLKLDALAGECSFIKGAQRPRLRHPLIYHTAHANWDLRYWREVNKLIRLDEATKDPSKPPVSKVERFRKLMYAITAGYIKLTKND